MKKKILGILLATLTITSMVPVFAATSESTIKKDDTVKSQEVIVSYNLEENYIVTIPADFSLALKDNATPISVSASDVKIANGSKLVVDMQVGNGYEDDSYKVTYQRSAIKYWINQGTDANNVDNPVTGADVEVLSIDSGTISGATYLKFYTTTEAIANATQAGAHKDTLTFTCGVEQ